jgi:acyl-[acyl-carrier-protein]-phospholipid O-acyltransferase/long-chain-fatty-acid--[acyl-carrier-protein] ligase
MIRLLLRAVFRLLFRVKVRGDSAQFAAARLLIVANHESFLDGLMLGLFLPVSPVFVVHTWVANNFWFRLILSQVDYLAVDPTNPLAMKRVVKLIESGRPVMVFPEGRLTVTGSLMKIYEGPAFAAARTGATIVPVRLDGPARSYFSRLSGQHPRRLFPKVTLTILAATKIEMPAAPTAKLRRRAAGDAMRRIMQNMLFASHPQQTLFTSLLDAIEIHGRGRHMVEDMRQIELTYGQLLRMTLAMGRLISGISAEDETVGVLLPNLASTVCLLFGMSAYRRVPAMLNYTAGRDGLQNACVAGRVRTIVSSRKFLETAKLDGVVGGVRDVRLVYLEDLQQEFSLKDKLWLLLYAQWCPRCVMRPSDPDNPALVLFTSGSEGKPKGVVLSHHAILANIAQVRAVVDFSPTDKFMNVLPIFHAFGLTCGSILPLVTGTKLFLYPSPLHYRVIPEVIYDRNCTVLFGTSTFLGNYAKFANPYDFYRLRHVVAGAEKLNDEVRRTWVDKFGIRILEGYGATETAPVLAVNTPMAYKAGTVGQLLPGIEHRLEPVPGIDEGGLLHVRGPNLMLGYYLYDSPATLVPPRSDLGNGWYNTGDVVSIDPEGFLTIQGRVKRFAKIAGEMVSLEVVEKIATAASPACQHAATTQSDPQRGENIVLFTTDGNLSRDALLQVARSEGNPELAVPRRIVRVDALPLLGTGKTDYVTLKNMAQAST